MRLSSPRSCPLIILSFKLLVLRNREEIDFFSEVFLLSFDSPFGFSRFYGPQLYCFFLYTYILLFLYDGF